MWPSHKVTILHMGWNKMAERAPQHAPLTSNKTVTNANLRQIIVFSQRRKNLVKAIRSKNIL
jgi:hypothetical protein